jgi:glyoxylase-like metal-dependent hydrolase (beta-lactamase superfamily II)
MLGEELRPGLWRWTAHHREWKQKVASYAFADAEELVLVDPLLEAPHWAPLEATAAGRELHVLLTIHWHARSAAELTARLPRTRVWAHSRNRAATARRTPVTDVFRAGDSLPADLQALEARPRSEVLFWAADQRALIAGDVLLGDGERGEGLHTCPASWLPQSSSLEDLRAALGPVAGLPVELVLPSHGAPVLSGARRALVRVAGGSAA